MHMVELKMCFFFFPSSSSCFVSFSNSGVLIETQIRFGLLKAFTRRAQKFTVGLKPGDGLQFKGQTKGFLREMKHLGSDVALIGKEKTSTDLMAE